MSRASTSSTKRTRSRMSAIFISAHAPAARRFRPAFGLPTVKKSSPSRGCRTTRSGSQCHRRRRGDIGCLHRGGDLMASALINVPARAKRGDIIEIKTLMSHIMETGYRHTATGQLVPRDIITSFTCRYNGTEIFRADLFPAIAANPFISFFTVATESGKFEFEWIGDRGFTETASASISVE